MTDNSVLTDAHRAEIVAAIENDTLGHRTPEELSGVVSMVLAALEEAEGRIRAKDEALLSAALNLDACACAIKKGGKNNGRHLLAEGWAQRARDALSPSNSEADSNGQ